MSELKNEKSLELKKNDKNTFLTKIKNSKKTFLTNIKSWKWWLKVVLYTIAMLLIFQAIQPLIAYKVWSDWWKTYGGDSYKQCIDWPSIAYYNNFVLYYYIRNLTLPGQAAATGVEIIFIMNLLKGQAKGIVPDGQITPKTICESIIPDVKMVHSAAERGITSTSYNPDANGWPHKADTASWRSLISSFAGLCWSSATNQTYCAKYPENWGKDPDNFLVRQYGIPYDSQLIQGFLTNWHTDFNGQIVYPAALMTLLGAIEGLGGWYGFLQSFQTGTGGWNYEEVYTLIWSDNVPGYMSKKTSSDPDKVCNDPSSYASAGTQAAMFGMMGASFGPLGIIAGLAIGYIGTREASGCNPVGGSSKGCFTGETKILMNDYSYKNMEDIKIGDIVISGKTCKCVKVIFKDSQNVDKINICSFNNGKFFTTESHSFIGINNDDKLTISNEDYMREVKKMVDTTQISKGNKIKTVNGPEKINNIKSKIKKNIQLYDLVTEDFSYTANDYCVFTAFPFDQNTKLTIITGKILLDDCKTPEIALKEFENSSETFENLLKRFFENATKDKNLINKGKELFRSNYEKYGKKQTKNLAEICYINC